MDAVLGEVWSLRGTSDVSGDLVVTTYVGPRVGGRLVVRFWEEQAIGAAFVVDVVGGG